MAHLDQEVTAPARASVVGGGWAGCAAAAALAAAGVQVTLHEAASQLGGRARRVELELGSARHALDNGQHLMLGAYASTASLLALVGVRLDDVVERRPFELRYADGFALCAVPGGAPWHLLLGLIRARGLPLADRIAMIRLLRVLARQRWRVAPDRRAATWLADQRQSEHLVQRVWRPLAIAALNTPLADASVQMLANVLRDSLGASAAACELWLPRTDLSTLLPEAVARFVIARGGTVCLGSRVDRIACDNGRFTVSDGAAESVVDAVVYAGPPTQLAAITAALGPALAEPAACASELVYQPICTVYLRYAPEVALPHRFLALLDNPAAGAYGQWVFDRGALDPDNRGVLAVVISAEGPHRALTLDALGAAVASQLGRELGLPAPTAIRTIVEKRATLKAVPGLRRPRNETGIARFALAGDWTDNDYPSTLESAVRSGEAAAQLVLR